MIKLVQVVSVAPQGGYRLRIGFSDGTAGIHDFAGMIAEGGPMVEPLRDPAMFQRVFIQCGVLAWPNGFDHDAIALHMEMEAAGELSAMAAA